MPESASRADRDNSPSESDTILTAADPVDTTVTTDHATAIENGPVTSVGNVPSSADTSPPYSADVATITAGAVADDHVTTADPLQIIDNHASTSNTDTEFTPEDISSRLTERRDKVKRARTEAYAGQLSQAERMVKRSRVDFKCGEAGDNVAVPVPMVDRGRGDARNILGVIVNRDITTDIYTIAVKARVLKGGYARNQFDLCPQKLLSMTDVNLDKHVSLRSAVIAESASGGQDLVKCNCGGGAKKCQTNKCSCFKAKLMCNSRCHGSLSCNNK